MLRSDSVAPVAAEQIVEPSQLDLVKLWNSVPAWTAVSEPVVGDLRSADMN